MRRHLFASSVACALLALPALAQTVPCTFQGRLDQAGAPASGLFDVRAELFDLSLGGVPLSSVELLNTSVTGGLLTVAPSFPAQVWNGSTGSNRWLQISVRPTGSGGGFTALTPRQLVTPTPLAARSLSDIWTVGGATASTVPGVSRLFVNGSADVVNDSILTVSSNTTGSGFAGMYVGGTSASTNSYYGWFANGISKAEARVSGSTGAFSLVLNNVAAINVSAGGLVALGSATLGPERLVVNGDTRVVGQVKANSFAYVSAQTKTLYVSGNEFLPGGDDILLRSANGLFVAPGETFATIVLPLKLPDGATITGISVFAQDRDPLDMNFTLTRASRTDFGTATLSSFATSGDLSVIREFMPASLTPFAVDNDLFQYTLTASCSDWPGAGLFIGSVRITYSTTNVE
ncbi:MAG TPA: hypothetical protein VK157_10525 [Phycisphaerales bacterium]|nr:hypothetical protein [Phycisphaerales bacterium]